MKLLFTGASGFLGNNILSLLEQNFNVETLGVKEVNNYSINLAKDKPNFKHTFDVVLHASGKAHSTPKTKEEETLFFDVNYQGTIHLCEALEEVGVPKSFVFISTVAVYGKEYGELIKEDTPLQGKTPYALSKIKAEQFLIEWCAKNNVVLSILRPSLIAGKNPKGNLGAMVNGIKTGKYISIEGGKARKSVLMVQDIAKLLPSLITKGGIYNICDTHHPSFRELENVILNQLGNKTIIKIPYIIAKMMAFIGDVLGKRSPFNSQVLKKMTKSLTFSNEKTKKELNWKPLNVIENFKIK